MVQKRFSITLESILLQETPQKSEKHPILPIVHFRRQAVGVRQVIFIDKPYIPIEQFRRLAIIISLQEAQMFLNRRINQNTVTIKASDNGINQKFLIIQEVCI